MHLHSTLGPCMAGSRCISIITSIMQHAACMSQTNPGASERKQKKKEKGEREGRRSAVSQSSSVIRSSLTCDRHRRRAIDTPAND